ncbi:hypothetical protein [Pedobacter sp. Hv1]|uniref:hypothetical protein n=1 Tax=Pedobacter sp. Hv1 TaxID=1740090 RepID=UPI0006D8BA23|nr:hypothetical protein [Pedobacter sp. Hv1]KQB99750.1 hypothetical protein AQF98_14600 [Pedobacter sp. Hv1]
MKKGFLIICIGLLSYGFTKAQQYTPKVSKDSVGILNARINALKLSIKVQELKIKEAEGETDIEKLQVKLLEANGNAKESATQHKDAAEKLKSGAIDAKAADKLAKKAKNDEDDAKKALDRYQKQIEKVALLRTEIQTEERKLTYKKPLIKYDYK